MSDDKKKVLNLDELFGQARAVKVIHDGKTFELLRLEAIGPKESVKFQRLRVRVSGLQEAGEDLTDEQASEVEELYDKMLVILCPELPLDSLMFAKKVRVLTFYIEETSEKKVMELALGKVKQTGARSSRG